MATVSDYVAKISHQYREVIRQLDEVRTEYKAFRKACENAPKTPEQRINAIDGKRNFYNLTGTLSFTATDDGQRGSPITFTVNQDGPYVMTHYPLVMWKPNTPTNATNFGMWRPVSTYPLADQVLDTDIVDISYEMETGGSERKLQNEAAPPLLSQPGNLVKLPVPTMFTENTTIRFIPTFENIAFNSGGTATTGGLLVVTLPGYRIIY